MEWNIYKYYSQEFFMGLNLFLLLEFVFINNINVYLNIKIILFFVII